MFSKGGKAEFADKCKACASSITRGWYSGNRERAIAASVQWRRDNPEVANAISRRYYQTNREQRLEYGRRRHQETPEYQKQRSQRYRDENKEAVAARVRRWQQANRERVAENGRRWQQENPERVAAKSRRWRRENPERNAENVRLWNEANRDRVATYKANRRAREAEAGVLRLSAGQLDAKYAFWGNRCYICGRDDVPLTLDHVKPVSAGGASMLCNYRPACQPCNSSKRQRWSGVAGIADLVESIRARLVAYSPTHAYGLQ
jgi:hypothetical protein